MFKRVWPVLLLLCVSLSIAYFNVQKGTSLIGWDSTQPELNFPLNLYRGLSAVWQEYRGLGVTDGMAHSANLIHLVYTWVLAQIVGVSYVRYVFTLLAHLIGGVGMYVLCRYLGRVMLRERISRWIALVGAFFYMLNPYTLQMFYQPLELFVTHFAALPWLTYTLIQYVSRPSRHNLGWFALVNILTLPQAHVPTLFIVWMMLAGCLLLSPLLLRTKRYGRQILMVIAVSVGINGFWGFPYIYSALNNAQNIGEAKINLLSNPEVLLRNDAYGDLASIVKMQGFSLAFEDWNVGYKYGLQMPEWVSWWRHEWIVWVMGGMFVLACVGVVTCLAKRKWWMGGVVLMYGVALGNLGARIPYVREIGALLRGSVPYYEAIFRFTFTKFALVYAFVLIILMIVGILVLYRWVRGKMSVILSVLVMGVSVAIAWPIWQGQFLYHNLRLKVPGENQNVFKFFDENSEGRVLPLPYPDFWGWQSNEWGYRGSGFVWQGIANPTLYGAFNAWSPYNEGFYNEFATALYGGESGDVERVLQKYDVRYALLDESVIAPGQDREVLRIEETKRLAQELGWKQKFHEGFLTVWEIGQKSSDHSLSQGSELGVSAPKSYTLAVGDTPKTRRDVIYGQLGTYVEGEGRVTYPFARLMREEVVNVEYGDSEVRVSSDHSLSQGSELRVLGWEVGESLAVSYRARLDNGVIKLTTLPVYTVNGQDGPRIEDVSIPYDGKYAFVQVADNTPLFVEADVEARGEAVLVSGREFAVKVYDGVVAQEDKPTGWTQESSQACGEGNELTCYAMRLAPPKVDSLLQTILPYTGTGLEVCLDREGEPYACVNKVRRGASPQVVTTEVAAGEVYWLDYVLQDKDIVLEQPLARWYPLKKTVKVEASAWDEFSRGRSFALSDKKITVSVPSVAQKFDMSVLGKPKPENCDVLKRGTASKSIGSGLSESLQPRATRYTADARGAVCDYVQMGEVDTNMAYLMRVKGEDDAGRSVKLFLWNTGSKRNDLEYLLGKGKFDQSFTLLPWRWQGNYTLNTETRSFGQYAENRLDPIEVRYFPLEQIAGIRVGTPVQTANNLTVESVKKTGTWLYRVEVERRGLLRLSQGYDGGWVGLYKVPNSTKFGTLQHVKVDGWANGWIVPGGGTVTIFYWPQLLEYLGFVILGVTVWLIWRRR